MTLIRTPLSALGLLGACLMAAPAAAQMPTAMDSAPAPLAFTAAAADAATLDSYRGGSSQSQVHNDMTLAGTTADNTAQHVNTGNNAISAGAFANMSGMPVVIQNSGANVLIQNAVIVHVQMN